MQGSQRTFIGTLKEANAKAQTPRRKRCYPTAIRRVKRLILSMTNSTEESAYFVLDLWRRSYDFAAANPNRKS
jgi:hypothetical protein